MKIYAAPLVLMLAACAPPVISLPVVGKLSNGDTAQGSVVIDLGTRLGEFDMVTLSGLKCAGSYDASVQRSTITIPVTCNNGRKGIVIATRDATGVAGTAEARIEGGLSGRFLFGNVSAQMQAEFLK